MNPAAISIFHTPRRPSPENYYNYCILTFGQITSHLTLTLQFTTQFQAYVLQTGSGMPVLPVPPPLPPKTLNNNNLKKRLGQAR